MLSTFGAFGQEVARVPYFADWTTKVRFFGVQAFAGLMSVNADTTALVKPTQQSAADMTDIFAQGARHFRMNVSIQQQTSMPAIFDSGDFDFGFHDVLSVTRIIACYGFIVNLRYFAIICPVEAFRVTRKVFLTELFGFSLVVKELFTHWALTVASFVFSHGDFIQRTI
jgi:hypothetical protein